MGKLLRSPDRYPCPAVTLFDFRQHDDAVDAARVQHKDKDAWRISDDRVIGGFSESNAVLIRSQADLERHLAGDDPEPITNATKENAADPDENDESRFAPFLRWSGTLDTTVGLESTVQRSGFAALRSPEFPFDGANLRGLYSALEIVCRTDGRLYKVNLKVSTSIPEDIYQGSINVSPNEGGDFDSLILPFSDFILTSMGREREFHRELDNNICIESVGFALMDAKNGDFQFDLARIRCINFYEGKIFQGQPTAED